MKEGRQVAGKSLMERATPSWLMLRTPGCPWLAEAAVAKVAVPQLVEGEPSIAWWRPAPWRIVLKETASS